MTIFRSTRRRQGGQCSGLRFVEQLEIRSLLAATITKFANVNVSNPWASVTESTAIGSNVFFVASENNSPSQDLWKSDGTIAGTIRLAGLGPKDGQPRSLTSMNGILYFRGYDAANGFELWKSNGTVSGTAIVRNLRNGVAGSSLSELTGFNGSLYFNANGDLFKSDGTSEGTTRLTDLIVGAADEVHELTQVGNLMYFVARDAGGVKHLYRTNGSRLGTVMISGVDGDSLRHLAAVDSRLFLVRNSTQIWKVEPGAPDGAQVWDGGDGADLKDLVNSDGTLFFTRYSAELLKTNGTSEGTTSIAYIGDFAHGLFAWNGAVYFAGGTYWQGNGEELWRSDGTPGGTRELKDINPDFNEGYGFGSYPHGYVPANGQLYFVAHSGLWKTDGTTTGTTRVTPSASLSPVNASGSLFFFEARSGGLELRKLAPGQSEPAKIPRTGRGVGSSNPSVSAVQNGTLYFAADDGLTGHELRRRNPDGSIELVADLNPGEGSTFITQMSTANGLIYFTVFGSAGGSTLWRSDGTAAGTFSLASVAVLPSSSDAAAPRFVTVGQQVFFNGATGAGAELWRSDGTVTGTKMIKDIFPGGTFDNYGYYPNSSSPSELTSFNGTLYFAASSAEIGRELWQSDGTATGTVLLKDIDPRNDPYNNYDVYSSNPSALRVKNGVLHFLARDETGIRHFVSDGSEAGTLTSSAAIPELAFIGATKHVADKLYFVGTTVAAGSELWISDGTTAGTKLLKDIRPGSNYSTRIGNLTAADNVLYFTADDGNHGNELWRSDGTTAGTAIVRDIRTDQPNGRPGNSYPTELTYLNGILYFSAEDGISGRELWRTNGTAGGATRIPELAPGAASTNPGSLKVLGNSVVFAANSEFGRELFRIFSAAPITSPQVPGAVYRENSLAVPVAPDTVLSDSDSAILNGGQLTVTLLNAFSGDVLSVVNQGINVVNRFVQTAGVIFGKLIQQSPGSLVVNLNANATLSRVQLLLRAIAFQAVTENPRPATRQIQMALTDGEGGKASRLLTVLVTPVNDAAQFQNISELQYQRSSSTGLAIAPNVVIADVDTVSLNGAELRLSVIGGEPDKNRLFIESSLFAVDGSGNLTRQGVIIGTVNADSGVGATPFVVTFNSAARLSHVQQFLQSIRFRAIESTSNQNRRITIKLTEPDGVESIGSILIRVQN